MTEGRGRGQPFPWSSLDRSTPDRVRALAPRVGRPTPVQPFAAFVEACGRSLGLPASIEVVATWVADGPPSRPGDLSVTLSLGASADLALSVENAVARRLTSLAAGRPIDRADDVRSLRAETAGGFAAFLAVAMRRTGAPWRLAAGELPSGPVACARAAVWVGEEFFEAVAAVPLSAEAPGAHDDHPLATLGADVRALAALGDVPLSLPAVVAVTGATDGDLAALEPGAAWAPGETWTALRGPDGAWRGTALLVAPLAGAGLVAEADSGQWRLAAGWRGCRAPTDAGAGEADPSLAVRVEVGTVTLPARAWARLSPGAPLPLPAGDAVTLRAGGDEWVRGRVMTLNGEQVALVEETSGGGRRVRGTPNAPP